MTLVKNQFRRGYNFIVDPKSVSIVMGLIYFGSFVFGLFALTNPPTHIVTDSGRGTMFSIGLLMTVGGAIGMPSALSGSQWSEKSAVLFVVLASILYGIVVSYDYLIGPGNRPVQLFFIYCGILFFVLRYLRINALPYDTIVSKQGREIEEEVVTGNVAR